MASDINRVILVGRLTRDPELKTTSGGSFYCRFSLASNRSFYKKETNETVDEAGFFDCVAWGKLAEVISKYVTKGRRIGIDGSLRFNSWEDSEGKRQSKVNIYVENFQFLESKQADNYSASDSSYGGGGSYPSENSAPTASQEDPFGSDDIPF